MALREASDLRDYQNHLHEYSYVQGISLLILGKHYRIEVYLLRDEPILIKQQKLLVFIQAIDHTMVPNKQHLEYAFWYYDKDLLNCISTKDVLCLSKCFIE